MAKRKAKRRTRRNKSINLLNLAEGVAIGNAMTLGFFGTNLRTFLTDGWLTDGGPRKALFDNSWEVTLGEMFRSNSKGWAQGRDPVNYPWSEVLRRNLSANGGMMVATMVLAPVVKRAVRKMGSPVFRPINQLMKGTGVNL